jgi:4-amino-4-deoxy-L-arabinose transferase-like glycosyltransferase
MLKSDRFLYAFVGSIALILGIAAIFVIGLERSEFADSGDYLVAARMLLADGSYPQIGSLPFFRPPLYPLFIAAVWAVVPGSIAAIKFAQVLLHAVTAILVFRSGELIFERKSFALIGALLFAVHPFFLVNAAAIQTETLHTFLITLAVVLFLKGLKRGRMLLAESAATGVSLGLATLCKPSALGVGLVLIAMVAALTFRQSGSLKTAVLSVATMFAAVLPWSFYNLQTRSEFILVNDAGGFNLWLGNNPATLRLYEGSFENPREAQIYTDYLGKGLASEQIAEFEETGGYAGLTAKERERRWSAKAIETMQDRPGTTLRLFFWKFFAMWKPFVSTNSYSMTAAIGSGVVQVPLMILGLVGFYFIGREKRTRKFALFFIVLAAAVTAIHVLIVSSMRLRMPYIDPLILVFAGIVIGKIVMIVPIGRKALGLIDGDSEKKRHSFRHWEKRDDKYE